MPTKPYVVNVEDLPKQERYGGAIKETAVLMDNAILKFAWSKAGSGPQTGRAAEPGQMDVHPYDQLVLVIKGHVEVTLGENGEHGTYEMHPGWLVYIPANMPHIGRLLGDEDAMGVDVFAPVRDDYLDMCQHQLEREND